MLVIRLSRTGRNKYPTYRIVAADSKRAATGKFVMILGHYNPHTKELVIKRDETAAYIKNGAQPSNAVIKLMKQEKVDLPEWAVLKTRNRKAKKAVAVPAASTAEPAASAEPAAAEPASETPTKVPESIAEVAQSEVETVNDNAETDNKAETAASLEADTEAAETAEATAASTIDSTESA